MASFPQVGEGKCNISLLVLKVCKKLKQEILGRIHKALLPIAQTSSPVHLMLLMQYHGF
jgi:hypothetical protein